MTMPLKTTQIQALILFLWPLIVFSIPNEFSLTDPSSSSSSYSQDNLIALFEQWMEKHEKIYEQPADKQRGFENFARNFAFAQERNSKREEGSHVVGLNKFADLSNEKFKAKHISKIHMGRSRERKVELRTGREYESCDAPKSLDWRQKGVVTAVKNQGQCGSCWAFSSTGALEGTSAIATGELVSLSEQELVDCVSTNWGCNGGYMDYAFEWVVNNGGIDTESDYVYTAVDGACNRNKEANKVVTINGYQDVESNDAALMCAVAKQPVSVGIDASTLDFQLYTGGIYNGNCSSNWDDIDHAVLIVGYGSENNVDYWIVKNSWDTTWGDKGYIKIKRNKDLENGTCAINAMASYPTIKSVSSS
ncbi:hypothetical protein LUZ60_013302 [Juncus effusus]|nr:hypothetical protein LUZ60_013302 [Juncus effusus]